MGKIFYAENFNISSEILVHAVLARFYDVQNATIARTKKGTPYLKNISDLFFSVSHTKDKIFIAFSNAPIGLDAELLTRKINYASILKKFPEEETGEILSTADFLKHWTIRESAIKYLGGTIASDFKNLSYVNDCLFYREEPLRAYKQFFTFEGHLLAICSETAFENAEFIPICPL